MFDLNLFLFIIFISHGFCDFVPLLLNLKINTIFFYILLIFINIYLHIISPDISTLLFVIISSIHFSGDFIPRNRVTLIGPGYLILGLPAILDRYTYIYYLKYLEIYNYNLFLSLLYFGTTISFFKYFSIYNRNRLNYFIIFYTVLTVIYGVHVVYYYMVLYHLPISLIELVKQYNYKCIIVSMIIGFVSIFCLLNIILSLYTQINIINYININKKIIFGTLFGLLNSHSLTTLLWRNLILKNIKNITYK